MRAFVLPTSVLGILVLVNLAGCYDAEIVGTSICYGDNHEEVPCCSGWPNAQPCPPDAGSDAETDAGDDAEADAGDGDGGPPPSECSGQCVPQGGGGWGLSPSFVWFGDEADTPPPPLAAYPSWEASVDVQFAEPACPVCSCIAPAAGCVLPSSWIANSVACQDPSAPISTPFDVAPGWDGACTSENAIAAGAMCNGLPCVRSLVVEPPTIAPCVPEPAMPPEGQPLPPPTKLHAIEYSAAQIGKCTNGIDRCIVPTPPGYRLCLVGYGPFAGQDCPEPWTERHDGWQDVQEKRYCSACSCGSVDGASCLVRVKAFTDAACVSEQGSMLLTSNDGAKCVDLVSGMALGSKSAEVLSYEPGSCAPSGGELVGEPFTDMAVTYCCLPELPPVP